MPLLLVFLALFVAGLVSCRISATLLQPDFYTDTLRNLDAYNFLYDQVVPLELAENDVDLQDLGIGISLTNEQLVGYAKRVLPTAWLQEQTESVAGELGPYLAGREDHFSIRMRLDDRVEEAVLTLKDVVRDSQVYGYVLVEVLRPELAKGDVLSQLPYGLKLTPDQVVAGVEEIVPEQWFLQQIDQGLDAVAPYLTSESETFEIVIPLQDRGLAALGVVEGWLQGALGSGAQEYLLQEQIVPVLRQNLGGQVQLPLGVTLTQDEMLAAVSQVLTEEWIAARLDDAVGALGPYLIGTADSFVVLIPLADRMQLAVDLLVGAVDAKYQALFESLPECTLQQLLSLNLSLDQVPPCVPAGTSYDQFKAALGLNLLGELDLGVMDQLPAGIEFTDRDLTRAVGSSGLLENVRGYFKEGYRFTDRDLRRVVKDSYGNDGLKRLNDIRGWIRDGFVVTDDDLKEELGADVTTLEDARSVLRTARSLLLAPFVFLLLVAAGVGFLGGRTWWSRLGWAGVPLLTSGLAVVVALLVGTSVRGGIADDQIQTADLHATYVAKLLELRQVVTDALVGPMVIQGVLVLVLGAVMVGLGVYGSSLRRRPEPPVAQVTSEA